MLMMLLPATNFGMQITQKQDSCVMIKTLWFIIVQTVYIVLILTEITNGLTSLLKISKKQDSIGIILLIIN